MLWRCAAALRREVDAELRELGLPWQIEGTSLRLLHANERSRLDALMGVR